MEENLELKHVLKTTLKSNGAFESLQAQLRAHIYNTLNEHQTEPAPTTCKETMLLNELIREYMKFNGYGASLSVFALETHLPKESADRDILMQELDINTSQKLNVPLLYGLMQKPSLKR